MIDPKIKFDPKKSPVQHFAESGAQKAPVLLTLEEMNVIKMIRAVEYGDVVVNIAKHRIMKIKPTSSYAPTAQNAMELLEGEETLFNAKGKSYGGVNT